MLGHVALVRNGVSEELCASIIRVTIIGELRTSAITSNRCNLRPQILYELQVFENRALRRIYEPRGEEMMEI
jgi:hypothetical protein